MSTGLWLSNKWIIFIGYNHTPNALIALRLKQEGNNADLKEGEGEVGTMSDEEAGTVSSSYLKSKP